MRFPQAESSTRMLRPHEVHEISISMALGSIDFNRSYAPSYLGQVLVSMRKEPTPDSAPDETEERRPTAPLTLLNMPGTLFYTDMFAMMVVAHLELAYG